LNISASTPSTVGSNVNRRALNSEVQRAAEQAVAETPAGNSVNFNKKRDSTSISSVYLMKCQAETELAEKKFKCEQDVFKENKGNLVNKNRQELLMKCVDKGYSPTTCLKYADTMYPLPNGENLNADI